MADEYKAVSNLTIVTALAAQDRVVVLLSNGAVRTANVQTFIGNTAVSVKAANLVLTSNATPANSSIAIGQGTLFYDDTYLYIATADNNLKRVALSTF